MKPDYLEIIREHNSSSVFMDSEGLNKAMDISFELGKKEGAKEVLEWLSKMDYFSDNLQHIKEKWENQNL